MILHDESAVNTSKMDVVLAWLRASVLEDEFRMLMMIFGYS